MVESGGIARLPKFNAECLNVVAINKKLESMNELNNCLKMEFSAYKIDYMKCQHQLSVMHTVLQQHTNVLRELRNNDGTFGIYSNPASQQWLTSPVAQMVAPDKLASIFSVTSSPTRRSRDNGEQCVTLTHASQQSVASPKQTQADPSQSSVTPSAPAQTATQQIAASQSCVTSPNKDDGSKFQFNPKSFLNQPVPDTLDALCNL